MQIKIFNIPINDNDTGLDDMNRFLRGNKVLQIDKQFVSPNLWSFCVTYIQSNTLLDNQKVIERNKVDYKTQLSEDEFARFSQFRTLRKELAKENAIPAYAIFTDEELANMARC